MHELYKDQSTLIYDIFGTIIPPEAHKRFDFCDAKRAELRQVVCKIFSTNGTSEDSKYFFEVTPEFVRSVSLLQNRWCEEFKRYVRELDTAQTAVAICCE